MFALMKTAVLAIFFAASVTRAGEVLKLASGPIDPVETQKKFSPIYARSTRNTEWIVQFKHPITLNNRRTLRQAGADIFTYMPEDALVVRADYLTLEEYAKTQGDVNAFIPYLGSYKVGLDIGITNIFNQDKNVFVLVKAFVPKEAAQLADQIRSLHSEVVVQEVEGAEMTVILPRNLIPMVAAMTGVERVQSADPSELMKPTLGSLDFLHEASQGL